jgi:hypothetical protein
MCRRTQARLTVVSFLSADEIAVPIALRVRAISDCVSTLRFGVDIGGLMIVSANNPRSMPSVARSAIRSRPLKPVFFLLPSPANSNEANSAIFAPHAFHSIGNAGGSFVK